MAKNITISPQTSRKTVTRKPVGKIKMLYNYITDDGYKFVKGEVYEFSTIIKIKKLGCKSCNGYAEDHYVAKGRRVPITRAERIS